MTQVSSLILATPVIRSRRSSSPLMLSSRAGTTVATQLNDAIGEIDFDAENTRMTVRVYSPPRHPCAPQGRERG